MIEVERVGEQRDCKHCSRTYGTLGCCSTVSNKWIYSCEEGHREYEETHKHMTIPEAIEVLAQDLPCETDEDLVEAMAMAIKALEQQPCEDCISRHDALNCVTSNEVRYRMVNDIRALPPVTPKENSEYEHDHEVVKAYNNGQAYILDKIRAEVELLGKDYLGCPQPQVVCDDVIKIIDKYRGDTDGKDSD